MLHLLQHVEVFAPESLGIRHVLVAGERVLWIGATVPDGLDALDVHVRDFDGRRLIPGLIDCHVHPMGGGGEDGFKSRVPPLDMSQFTRAGTTTIVGMLGVDDTTRTTGSLLACTRALIEQGMSAYCLTGGYHVPPVTLTGSVTGDIVHLDPVIGVGEIAISDHRSSQPTLDELLRLAGEAHVGGLLSGKAGITHLHLGDGRRGLTMIREALEHSELPPGCFQPTHVNRRPALFDEAVELVARGCTIDVTAFPVAHVEDAIPAAQALRTYLERGLPRGRITVSTDAGGSLPRFDDAGRTVELQVAGPGALANCLAEVLAAGVPLADVLPAFTSNVADVLRLRDKGRIRVAGAADLAVLDESGRVTDVMARGRWHVSSGKSVIRGLFER